MEFLTSTRTELGDSEGARELALSLLAAQRRLSSASQRDAPRVARSVAIRELKRLQAILTLAESWETAIDDLLAAQIFETLESLRCASTVSAEIARASQAIPQLKDLRDELADVRRQIADASQSVPTESSTLEVWRSRLYKLSERRDALQRRIRRELESLDGVADRTPSLEILAAELQPGAALVTFWRQQSTANLSMVGTGSAITDSLSAFLLTPNGNVKLIDLGPAQPLEGLAKQWRAAMGTPMRETRGGLGSGRLESPGGDEGEIGRELMNALMGPVLAAFGKEPPSLLHIVPDEFLFLIPLDALPFSEQTRLGEVTRVRIHPSVARLGNARAVQRHEGTLLVMGGVEYGAADVRPLNSTDSVAEPGTAEAEFDPLIETGSEATFVARLYESAIGVDPHLLKGKDASESALIRLAPDARYLHIATHGWFTPESDTIPQSSRTAPAAAVSDAISLARGTVSDFLPETLCGIALAGANHGVDGRMTAEEIATLALANCDLAVLSACETNVGVSRAGQGIQSLQTALHAAGARSAITSLWRVDDEATRRIFEKFYSNLWASGASKEDALWQAKMAMAREGFKVKDWGAWVLTGVGD